MQPLGRGVALPQPAAARRLRAARARLSARRLTPRPPGSTPSRGEAGRRTHCSIAAQIASSPASSASAPCRASSLARAIVARCRGRSRLGRAASSDRPTDGGRDRAARIDARTASGAACSPSRADEAATDRVVGLLGDGQRAGVRSQAVQRHRVRVARQAGERRERDVVASDQRELVAAVEQRRADVAVQLSRHRAPRRGRTSPAAARRGRRRWRRACRGRCRSRRGSRRARSVMRSTRSRTPSRRARSAKCERGPHRPDRVGTGRADPDGEEVEGGDVRCHPSNLRRAGDATGRVRE